MPMHVLIEPREHKLVLIDWCCAAHDPSGPAAGRSDHRRDMRLVQARRRDASPADAGAGHLVPPPVGIIDCLAETAGGDRPRHVEPAFHPAPAALPGWQRRGRQPPTPGSCSTNFDR